MLKQQCKTGTSVEALRAVEIVPPRRLGTITSKPAPSMRPPGPQPPPRPPPARLRVGNLHDPGADAGSATDPARNRVGDLYDPGATRPNRRRGGWFTKAQSLARAVLAEEFDEARELAEDRLLRIKY